MTLRSIAQELTESHLKAIGGRIGKVPSLLSELRDAVAGSSDTGAGGSSSKARILVDASALDLLNQIDCEVRSVFSDRYGEGAPILETCIELIGKGEHPDNWDQWLTGMFDGIKGRIETYLRPKKMRRLDGIDCPSCGMATYGDDRVTALYVDCWVDHENLRPHQDWMVICKACDVTWTGVEEIKWVLVALTSKSN